MKSKCLVFLLLVLALPCTKLHAQKFKYSIPGLDTLEQQFIVSGAASTVLRNGQTEVTINNSLVSYWIAFHENGDNSPVLDRLRNTQFSTDISVFYGLSPTSSWDIGLQFKYTRSLLDNEASNSLLNVFKKKEENDFASNPPFNQKIILDEPISGISSIGLRYRIKPIARRPELVLSGGYTVGTVGDKSKEIQLGADRDIIDVGATYYQGISTNVYYFFGASIRAFLPSSTTDESLYNTNFNFFLIQRSKNRKFTYYPGLSYSLNFKPSTFDAHPLIKTADFLFAFGGIQYAFNGKLNIFATAGFPLIVNVTHPQQEIVRESYSALALGVRALF